MIKANKDSYVLYFDILGYRSFFEAGNDSARLLQSIVTLAHNFMEAQLPDAFGAMGFRTRVFSDNFFICASPTPRVSEDRQISMLLALAALIQVDCLSQHGLLIRGGITRGFVHIDDSVIFGDGLIRAVELEETAFFPRVLVDDMVAEKLMDFDLDPSRLFVSEDYDGKWYVHSLAVLSDDDNWVADDTSNLLDGIGHCTLSEIKAVIEKLIKKNCRYASRLSDPRKIGIRESVIRKHAWLASRFNDFCQEEGKKECLIDWRLSLNPKTTRAELVC